MEPRSLEQLITLKSPSTYPGGAQALARGDTCRGLLAAVEHAARRLRLPPGGYIVVFGSVAEGRCSGLSDVDIAVKGLGPLEAGRLAEEVEAMTGRRVDIVLVERAGLPLLYEALARGVLVAGDRRAFTVDRWRVTLEWLDYVEAYERMHRSYRRRVLEARGATR